jgi:hypothetical protein
LNIAIFFHVFTKEETPQNKKPCARRRDAARNALSASGDPAMVSGFRMASILSLQSRAPCPLRPASRIAAGRSIRARFVVLPLSIIAYESRHFPAIERSCKSARQATRAYFIKSSTPDVVLF